ncbi:MAG: hypothetical protein WAU65_02475 [Candidatus Nanoarchaeia archaeon]
MSGESNKNKFAVIGFILGLVAIISTVLPVLRIFPPLEFLALVSIVVGLIFSIIGIKSEKKKFAIAGLIINSILLLLSIVGVVVLIIKNINLLKNATSSRR